VSTSEVGSMDIFCELKFGPVFVCSRIET